MGIHLGEILKRAGDIALAREGTSRFYSEGSKAARPNIRNPNEQFAGGIKASPFRCCMKAAVALNSD